MESISQHPIENKIVTVRGFQVMLDSDLASLYGSETKFINRAVKRNPLRFPESFVFQLKQKEWDDLRFHFGTLEKDDDLRFQTDALKTGRGRHRKYLPYVFTEQGVAMLSSVLNTEIAILASIRIMQAFVNMRKFLLNNASVFQRLDQLELRQLKSDEKLERIFKALEAGQPKPDKGIFFDGQVFDAYVFAADLIKQAQKHIVLIDNYIDESVLMLLAKRKQEVSATIYTQNITKALQLDAEKHAQQYPAVHLKVLKKAHDRFLVIDDIHLYHIGASLKDLGKKWFAFSKMDHLTKTVLNQLKTQLSV